MAGVQALIDQQTAQHWGNPNTVFYELAAAEYGAGGNRDCTSTRGKKASASCVFYDETEGDMDVDCTGAYDCYLPSGDYGVLSKEATRYKPAFRAGKGWDFTTGIGTINVANLVNAWR
jgi:subtilase family serine protease